VGSSKEAFQLLPSDVLPLLLYSRWSQSISSVTPSVRLPLPVSRGDYNLLLLNVSVPQAG
jgi:hypothetical protein